MIADPKKDKDIFRTYKILMTLYCEITNKAPLRIGASKSYSVIESNLPIIKNSDGRPILPGSSLKGFFRANILRILTEALSDVSRKITADKIVNNIFGKISDSAIGSAVFFHTLVAEEGYTIADRPHISIKPETGGVGHLFSAEALLEGAIFKGPLLSTRNLNPFALSLFKLISDLTNEGILRIGGYKSRGYGIISIKFKTLEILFPGKTYKSLEKSCSFKNLLPEELAELVIKKIDDQLMIFQSQRISVSKIQKEQAIFGTKVLIEEEKLNQFLEISKNVLEDVIIGG